jgi:hypothetical protein
VNPLSPSEHAIQTLKEAAAFAAAGNAEESRAAYRRALITIVRELGFTQRERELVSTLCVHAEGRGVVPFEEAARTLQVSSIPRCPDCHQRNCTCKIAERRF